MKFNEYSKHRAITSLNNSPYQKRNKNYSFYDISPEYPHNTRVLPKKNDNFDNGKNEIKRKNTYFLNKINKLNFDPIMNINRTQTNINRNKYNGQTSFSNFNELNNKYIVINNNHIKSLNSSLNEEHKNTIETITIRNKWKHKTEIFNKLQKVPQKKYNAELILYLYPENNYIKLRNEFIKKTDDLDLDIFINSNDKYLGHFIMEKRIFIGRFIVKTDTYSYYYKGRIRGIHAEGFGYYKNIKSSIYYEGMWLNSKKEGFGIEEDLSCDSKYKGNFKDGKKSGIGSFFWSDGSSYIGEWENDNLNGYGIYNYPDGSFYKGQWKDGKTDGLGEFTIPEIQTYFGYFFNDLKSGFGIIIWYKKRKIFLGYWKNNKKHGLGKLINNGKITYGIWENGILKKKIKSKIFFIKQIKKQKHNYSKLFILDNYDDVLHIISNILDDDDSHNNPNKGNDQNNGKNNNEFNNKDNPNKKNYIKPLNLIYLIDTSLSMKKYEKFIYTIPNINFELIKDFKNIDIGYVLYSDYENGKNYSKSLKHIKIYKPSKTNIDLNRIIKFSGGNDYSEDWGNTFNKLSKITNKDGDMENIVIHICDANAHGTRFSYYDDNNEQKEVLIDALFKCKIKNIKFIGILIDDWAKKSFIECKKLYNEIEGFYEIIDMSKKIDMKSLVINLKKKIEIFLNNMDYKYPLKGKDQVLIDHSDIKEYDFVYNNKIVTMKHLYEVYPGKRFTLPKDYNKKFGVVQGNIGDCYLISSIISMANIPLVFNYIFKNSSKINEKTEFIEILVYENGMKKNISFKNTYATNNNKLLFAKPFDNSIFAIALEKCYAILNCTDDSIGSGYKKIGDGGYPHKTFETFLGSECEKYHRGDNNNLSKLGYKYIPKEKLKYKIKKYIDLGGVIAFGVYFNLGNAHAYSLIGYKTDKNGNLLIEIVNPHRRGHYATENIIYSEDDDIDNQEKLKEMVENKNQKYEIISEKDFINEECKKSLIEYQNTGYLIMEFDTFYKWFSLIDMCDPMIGYYEQIIEFIPDGKNIYQFKFNVNTNSKFRAYIFIKNDKNENINNYSFIIKSINNKVIYNDDFDLENKLCYGYLEKGNYIIEIKALSGRAIKHTINLKIFTKEKLEVNNSRNNFINMGLKYPKADSQVKIINKFIDKFCNEFIDNDLGLIELPNKKSIYFTKNNKKNFYASIINTHDDFYVEFIYKYKWENVAKMEPKSESNKEDFIIETNCGNFECSKDLDFKNPDDNFKEIIKKKEEKQNLIDSESNDNNRPYLNEIIQSQIKDIIGATIYGGFYGNPIPKIIDIVYLIDSTGSMGDEVKNASKLVNDNADYLTGKFTLYDFQFGVIYYSDKIDCETDKDGFYPLTKDLKEIKNFCDKWEIQSGGDEAEDWAGGYEIALNEMKWRDDKRIIVHICDAPAHGEKFSKNCDDNHKERMHEKKLEDLIKKCAEDNIIIVGIYLNDGAKNCFLECKKIYENNQGISFKMQKYNPNIIIDFIS